MTYDPEKEYNWKIEIFGKFNRVYTSIGIIWEDTVTDETAYEIFLELMDSSPPRFVIEHAASREDGITAYEARLVCDDNGHQAAHIGWLRQWVAILVDDYKKAEYTTVTAQVKINLPKELLDDNENDLDLIELVESGFVDLTSFVIVDSVNK